MPSTGSTTTAASGPRTARSLDASFAYMEAARRRMPLGVTSSKRAGQRPTPLAIAHAAGSRITDEDGNEYLDYVAGYGPMLLGHDPHAVIAHISRQLQHGWLYAAQHRSELALAEQIIGMVPSAELVALFSSGSEAIHAALAIARGATGRTGVVKFEGHFHGWIAPVTANLPETPPSVGPPPHPRVAVPGWPVSDDVHVARWNDLDDLAAVLARHGVDVAAVLMEPVMCNAGTLLPHSGYLEGVRRLCDRYGAVLVFDEIITGFRVARGGAQERFGVRPDLTVLGKALGSGLPIAAVAGTAAIMEAASVGPVRLRGTYNGNAISVAAATATLAEIEARAPAMYELLEERSATLGRGLEAAAAAAGLAACVNRFGSHLNLLLDARTPTRTYADVMQADSELMADLQEQLLLRGILTGEGLKWFVSTAHSAADIAHTIELASDALAAVAATHGP